MLVSRKTQYALLAALELARRYGDGPVPNHLIAGAQAIPPKFLEAILNELSRAGIVAARRGSLGGYQLVTNPSRLRVETVIEAVQGPIDDMACPGPLAGGRDRLGERAFMGMWGRVSRAVSEVLGSTTLRDVLDEEKRLAEITPAITYAI